MSGGARRVVSPVLLLPAAIAFAFAGPGTGSAGTPTCNGVPATIVGTPGTITSTVTQGTTSSRDSVATDDEVDQVSDRWRPYRSLAVSYLFASGNDG